MHDQYWREKYLSTLSTSDLSLPPQEADRAHLFTTAAGIFLPAGQAIITGGMVGILAGVYAAWLGSEEPVKWAAGVGLAVIVVTWILLIARWSSLTAPLERMINRDLNNDGVIGRPDILRVEVKNQDRRSMVIAELPAAKKLPEFARGVLSGAPLSEKYWSGSGALFSVNEYRALRDILIARGLMRWNNDEYHEQGISLTSSGNSVFKALNQNKILPTKIIDIDDSI